MNKLLTDYILRKHITKLLSPFLSTGRPLDNHNVVLKVLPKVVNT